MNFDALDKVLKSDLPCPQRMIMVVLLNHAGDKGVAWPSQATIAQQTGQHEDTTGPHLVALEKAGWIRREKRGCYHYHILDGSKSSGKTPDSSGKTPGTKKAIPSGETPGASGDSPVSIRQNTGQTTKEPLNEPPIISPAGELGFVLEAPKPPAKQTSAPKAPKAKAEPLADSRHKELVTAYHAAWSERTGKAYGVNGRDAKAVQNLLKATPESVEKLMESVKWCWHIASTDNFADRCAKAAGTLQGFCENYNAIQDYMLRYANLGSKPKASQPSHRPTVTQYRNVC